MLEKSRSGGSTQPEKMNLTSRRVGGHSISEDLATNHQQQHELQDQHQHQRQHQENTEDSMQQMPEPTMNEQGLPFWLNDSPCFNNVDQLLSPGFSISENVFHSFFTSYDNGIVVGYDQGIPPPSDDPIDLLYNA
jgi:hypothetical protein